MGFSKLTLVLLTLCLLATLTAAATFNCTTPTTASSHCRALVDYVTPNATTLNSVKALFNITHLRDLLGVNNLPLSTRPDSPVPAQQKLRIPFKCLCANGTGVSNRLPQYVIKPGDGLDHIATDVFSRLVTYQEIDPSRDSVLL